MCQKSLNSEKVKSIVHTMFLLLDVKFFDPVLSTTFLTTIEKTLLYYAHIATDAFFNPLGKSAFLFCTCISFRTYNHKDSSLHGAFA